TNRRVREGEAAGIDVTALDQQPFRHAAAQLDNRRVVVRVAAIAGERSATLKVGIHEEEVGRQARRKSVISLPGVVIQTLGECEGGGFVNHQWFDESRVGKEGGGVFRFITSLGGWTPAEVGQYDRQGRLPR